MSKSQSVIYHLRSYVNIALCHISPEKGMSVSLSLIHITRESLSVSLFVIYHLRSAAGQTGSCWIKDACFGLVQVGSCQCKSTGCQKNNRAEIDADMIMCFVCACKVVEGDHQTPLCITQQILHIYKLVYSVCLHISGSYIY